MLCSIDGITLKWLNYSMSVPPRCPDTKFSHLWGKKWRKIPGLFWISIIQIEKVELQRHSSPKAEETVVQGTLNWAMANGHDNGPLLSKFCSMFNKFELQSSLGLVWNQVRAVAISGNSKSLEVESEHHVHQYPCKIWLQWRTTPLITNPDFYQSLDNMKASFLPIEGNGWELHMFSDQDP